ncbi:hypothetical protein [Mycobacterium sp. 852014-52144_SCH5372336]|uniref:hypothetical protein n=1 Tax=Mycobacterium sp. 852014-52144_SCH5372336 TaxID=1834115 RepID=UPI0007FC6019|nr:hypothetical protein [Mycobacterium sp. 852014-52144_SCH5372336]OBB71569.1 hypothetical protein A5759_20560 [Mycobacterium sp. 852014-52144_SCH5372336]
MVDSGKTVVPVWTLATRDVPLPPLFGDEAMTPERLGELRTVLAALADAPIATLEAHPMPKNVDRSRGLHLDSASPLAMHLSQLMGQTSRAAPVAGAAVGGEVLYRMVVPAKVAAQFGGGMLKPMAAKTGGVHSALIGASGIKAQASFVPVAGKSAVAGAAGVGALTVAAPLVLMAVAAGISAHADRGRQEAIENITALLEKLHDDALQRERSNLNGCRGAIDNATAILLDQGRIGVSLGLDSAVHAISVAMADAEERLKKWQRGLAQIGNRPVEIATLRRTFSGIDEGAGEFYAHLELARLAIALKKRVLVLQAVEHAQMDPSNPFENFVRALRADQRRVAELESGIAEVLSRLSTLQLDRPHGVRDVFIARAVVDNLLRTSYRLRELGEGVGYAGHTDDVTIEIAQTSDGSVVVLPATAAA